MSEHKRTGSHAFGPFRVDLRTGLLWRGNAPVALTPKASELLSLLVEHGEAGITKSELMERLWPDTVVLENNLTVTMSALRKALGESAASPRYIQTLPRRGYRFVPAPPAPEPDSGAPQVGAEGVGAEPLPEEPPPSGRARPHLPALAPDPGREREAPFVGRVGELAFLRGRLEEALSGRGRVVCLAGEPGIGKTWLSEHLLGTLGERSVRPLIARGRCLEAFGSGEAYWPFLELLDAWLTGPDSAKVRSLLRKFAPTWYLQFPGMIAPEGLAELQREALGATQQRMLRELGLALAELARDQPLVMLIEDLHWADPSTIDLLRLLCQRSREHAWFVLGTFRAAEAVLENLPLAKFRSELATREYDEVSLGPLGEAHVESYLAARFTRSQFPAGLARFLIEKTEGHPLFLTRLVSLLVERGEIRRAEGLWALDRPLAELVLDVPVDVRGTLQRQLERLAPAERRALAYASVEGEEFSSVVLAALCEEDELTLQERLAPLYQVHGLLQLVGEERWPDGRVSVRYRFAHALYQSVLYESLVSARRAQLHRRAAEVLVSHFAERAPLIAVSVARHFDLGGDVPRAVHYFGMAGQRAHELLAHQEAREHLSRAIALVERLPAAERDAAAVPLCLARGWVDFDMRSRDFGRADFDAACQHGARSQRPELECEALFAASALAYFEYRLEASRQLDLRLDEVARASGQRALMALSQISFAGGYLVEGNVDEAARHHLAAEALLDPGSPPNLRAMVHLDRGRCERLRSRYAEALTDFEQALPLWLGISGTIAISLYQEIGRAQANLGKISTALASYRQAAELARKNGQEFRMREQPSGTGWIWRELGHVRAARSYHEAALAQAREQGAGFTELSHLIDLALDELAAEAQAPLGDGLRLARASLVQARSLLESGRVRAFPCDLNGARLRLLDAECSLERAQSRWAEARERAEALSGEATRLAWPKYIAVAHAQLGRVERASGAGVAALRELERAVQILALHQVPIVSWRVQAELAHLHAELGDRSSAREAARAAYGVVVEIAEAVIEPELRQCFLACSAAPDVRALATLSA